MTGFRVKTKAYDDKAKYSFNCGKHTAFGRFMDPGVIHIKKAFFCNECAEGRK